MRWTADHRQAELTALAVGPSPDPEARLAALHELGRRPYVLLLAQLHHLVDDRHEGVTDEAARLASWLLADLRPDQWAALDRTARSSAGGWWRPPDVKPVIAAARACEQPTAALVLMTMSPSGYVRQAAVEALAGDRDPRSLPAVLVRLDDWVPPVAEAAERAASARIAGLSPRRAVELLPLTETLLERDRGGRSASLQTLARRANADGEALWMGLGSESRRLRRSSAGRLGARGVDPVRLLRQTLVDPDPVVARRAVAGLRGKLDRETFGAVCLAACLDDELPVREDLLVEAAKYDLEAAVPALRRGLLDPRGGLRFAASWYLRKVGAHPGPAFYREAVTRLEGRSLRAAVAALGDDGSDADLPLVLELLDDRRSKLCRVALEAAHKLGAPPEALVPLVASRSRRVSWAAVTLLRRQLVGDFAPLRAMLLQPEPLHVARGAAELLAARPEVADLPALFAALDVRDQEVRDEAKAGIRRWLEKRQRQRDFVVSYRLSEADRAGLAEAVAGANNLPPWLQREFDRILR